MATIRIISESTVRPARPMESTRRIELTPWDLQFLLTYYNQKGILLPKPPAPFRPPKNDCDPENDPVVDVIDHLKASLSRTLSHFFPLAGRLASTAHDGGATSFYVDCNDAGAQFVHAATDAVTTADILHSVYTPSIVNSFFTFNGIMNCEGTSNPLLGVQATELADGGIFLACSVSHVIADGTAFWNFFNSWSELSRTCTDRLSRPPILNRWFLDDSPCPIKILNFPSPGEIPRFFYPPPLKERVFNFRNEKLQNLKARANAEMGGSTKISSLQALLAHLWRALIRARQIPLDMETSNKVWADGRSRLTPPLPEEYFGNAIAAAAATARAGDLEKQGLGFAAAEMNKMVALQTGDKMRTFVERWVEDPKLWSLSQFSSNALVTGSSPRFKVYGNDFGWGKPAAVRSGGANKFDGKMTVYPGNAEGSIDLEACLSPETLEALAEDEEFMEAVTV